MATLALGPAYRRLWWSTALTNVGDGLRLAAFPLLAASLTDSPALIAGIAVAAQLPWLAFGLFAGAYVDRVDRRRLLASVDALRVILLGALVVALVAGHATIWLLYAVAFALGTCETLRDTAASTLVPALLSEDRWERANGLLVTAEVTGNELIGPAIGGALFAASAVLPFAANSGALAIAVILVLSLPGSFRPPEGGAPDSRIVADVRAGVRFLLQHRLLRTATALMVLVALLDAAWFAILVIYARDIVHVTGGAFGLLLSVSALGGIAGGTLADRVTRRIGPGATLAATVLLTGAAQLSLGVTSSVYVTVLSLAVSGGAFAVANVAVVGLRQRTTPPAMLGRVTASYRTVGMGAAAVGAAVGGALATGYGVRAPVLIGAPILIALGLLAMPVLRRPVLDS